MNPGNHPWTASTLPSGLHAFLKTRRDLPVPDIQFLFRGAPARAHPWFPGVRPAYEDSFGLRPVMLHPESRGRRAAALGRAHRSGPDRAELPDHRGRRPPHPGRRESGARHRAAPGLDTFRGRETAPGPDCRTGAEIDAFVRRTAITVHHPCGTCAMGIGEDTVLDPALRVRGVERLRMAAGSEWCGRSGPCRR